VSAIENLQTSIKEEMNAQKRAEGLTALLDDARNLIWLRRLTDAVSVLEKGVKSFPGDTSLERLLQAAEMLDKDASHQEAVSAIADKAGPLRKEGRLDEALDLVKDGLRRFGNHTILLDLSRVLTLEIEDRRSRDRLEHCLASAADLLKAGSALKALVILREARTQFPTEPALELSIAGAEELYAQQSEHDIVASILQIAQDREKSGDLAGAAEEINKGLRRLPTSKDLLSAASELQVRTHIAEREKRIQTLTQEIQTAIDAGEWAQATAKANAAQREYPDQTVFDELASQIRTKQRAAEVEKAVAPVRELLKNGNLDWGAIALAQLEPAYGKDEIWKAEKRTLEKRLAYLDRQRKAEDFRNNGEYDKAEPLLQALAEEDPGNAQVAALLKVVRADMLSANSEQVYRKGYDDAEKLRNSGDYPGALRAFTDLSTHFPQHNELLDVIQKIRSQMVAPAKDSARPKRRVRFDALVATAPEGSSADKGGAGFCGHCGVVLPERARFCDSCGKPANPL
jgi:TolA-binding protein